MTIVMKFGGSSLKDANMIKKVSDIIISNLDEKPVVVLSAVGGTTDLLISAIEDSLVKKLDSFNQIERKHNQILKDLKIDENLLETELTELKNFLSSNFNLKANSPRIYDYVYFFGERMSTKIVANYLTNVKKVSATALISGEIGLITDSNYGNAKRLEKSNELIDKALKNITEVPVITGFGGKDEKGEFTTFSRGGSDYVASAIGSSISAKRIEIWTDVDGFLSADPRIVDNTKTIEEITYDEASELAYFGAKVLHPKTILPAVKKKIPVLIKNTYNPEHKGSEIIYDNSSTKNKGFIGTTYKKDITIVEITTSRMIDSYGYVAHIFEVFGKHKTPVDMISTSEINISITIDDNKYLKEIVKDLEELGNVRVHKNNTIVYLVGRCLEGTSGLMGEIFKQLGEANINIKMTSQPSNELSIGFVIDNMDAEKAVKILHEKLINKKL